MNAFLRMIENNPITGATTTAGTAVVGYAPKIASSITESPIPPLADLFQYAVWTISITVGIITAYISICKERDRLKDRRKGKRNTKNDE